MTKTTLKELIKDSAFKDVPALTEFFGESWDLLKRIVVDPAHNIDHIVEDVCALISNMGNMKFKKKYVNHERKKNGRYSDISETKYVYTLRIYIMAFVY